MSGTMRTGIVFGIAAVVAFIAGVWLPLPAINLLLAFGSMLVLGWGAGYTAAKTAQPGTGRGVGRGTVAGLIAGGIMLVVSTVLFGLLTTPAVRQALGANFLIADTIGGTGGGFCLGLVSLILLGAGGAVGGLMWRGVPSIANTGEGAYGASPVGQGNQNTPVNDPPAHTRTAGESSVDGQSDGNVRVYDQPDT